jgi:ketosteroid isomerase-like protein
MYRYFHRLRREVVTEALIRQRVEDLSKAIRAKDIDGVMSLYAPNIVSFDIDPPLQYAGADRKRRAWQELFTAYSGPITYEIRDLNVTTQGELAFVHSVNHVNGTLAPVKTLAYGCVGRRASAESMASGWLCTTTYQSQQTSSMARLF